MATDNGTNARTIRIALPAALDQLAKHGPWVLLSFLLVYYVLLVPKPATSQEVDEALQAVKANEIRLIAIQSQIGEAYRMMHDVSVQRQESERAIVHTLTQMCLLLAEGPIARQACWDTMRGAPPKALR